MVRYKAIISYDGTLFAGFQRQQQDRTVQEELEKTLMRLNRGEFVAIHGAGRTDAGVHALAQVVHFDLSEVRDCEKLRFALDTQSPEDISVKSVEVVAPTFHCRYAPHCKVYEFLVDNARSKNPMLRHYATYFPYELDWRRMKEAAKLLVGTHDFTGFTASGSSVDDKVRTILAVEVDYDASNQLYRFTFAGNGFLYKQVRNMVGTLLRIGNSRMPVEQIDRILSEKNRQLAGPTAAPSGLYLKEVRYDD